MITLEKFTEELKKIYGEKLISVVLYGSAATGEYIEKISDYNILVILDELSVPTLKKSAPLVNKWIKYGNPPPLMFTNERFHASTDVFPIEFLDMQDCHKVLYGTDPFEDLDIEQENFRTELEHELKGKLIQVRERYLMTAGKSGALKALLSKSLSTFLALFRNVLRLYGEKPPIKKLTAVEELVKKIPFDMNCLYQIEKLRQGDKSIPDKDLESIMERYITTIENVVDAVDKLGK